MNDTPHLHALAMRTAAADGPICQYCDGFGWLYFRCGTPWRCKCNQLPREYASNALKPFIALETP